MTDRFLFGIIIDDTIIKNSEAKWREKDRKKIKGLVSGGNLPYHAQYIIGIKKIFIWNNKFRYVSYLVRCYLTIKCCIYTFMGWNEYLIG